eukprot:TRINITY_DN27078_c0_g1_i1.p1 TRINITY_DN27078_c0_g1~~TRINITY_DN27078_c0_g1_i1.p1  ORF type:complete len:849 (+),score=238.17 TRINITY_DN27078_c0_g1_i1:224-2770(+)
MAADGGGLQARRERRRVGALLNNYYAFQEDEKKEDSPAAEQQSGSSREDGLDKQGFDAKRYFDSMLGSGQLPDLMQHKQRLDQEVKDLDSGMQVLVYENYSKFIRATDLIKDMKVAVDSLEPDVERLQGSMEKMNDVETRCEEGVSLRSSQLATLLKQQSHCKKLQVLFDLPRTLQAYHGAGAFRQAIDAYTNCVGFLRRHQHTQSFKTILEAADKEMEGIRSSLKQQLVEEEKDILSVDEAVRSAEMLRDLGAEPNALARDYLVGRGARLRATLDVSFSSEALPVEYATSSSSSSALPDLATGAAAAPSSREVQEWSRPESEDLKRVCGRATSLYIPLLCDTVDGLQQFLHSSQTASDDARQAAVAWPDEMASEFVARQVQLLCDRICAQVEQKYPPTRVLVWCIDSLRDALRRLNESMPQLLKQLFMSFLGKIAGNAAKSLFSASTVALVTELRKLHAECERIATLPPKKSAPDNSDENETQATQEEVLEAIAKSEQALIMHAFTALTESQPLLGLLTGDWVACQALVQLLHEQLIVFFLAFVDVCDAYIIRTAVREDASLPVLPQPAGMQTALESIEGLSWNGLFALALVRIGRHLEIKALGKVWAVAKDLIVSSNPQKLASAASELVPNMAVIRATRSGAQAVITHYVSVSGHSLADKLRDSMRHPQQAWAIIAREPKEARAVVEVVLKALYSFDGELALVLGDPRKTRAAGDDARRRLLNQRKSEMELQIEREWAKKVQVYAPVPFNRNGAMLGILRVAFKAFYESVREETFGRFGLQQLQVDCAFLGEFLREFVENEEAGVMDSLLDEVVTSASQRCTDPVQMDVALIEKICDEKKKAFKFD